ncbi:hypothetical protein POM88_022432 [Heracleum sosnowskyi]|uniref:SHSP domain-containing protein n=1 Tax=Heracleum sosnowskyi TaxID=360622 RepID=A0AAD8IF02_9APIA|nr:hypothetical protein POM88_022432 [Heracleum sosnowskyi]
MDSKLAATYEEFEPLCKWQREEGSDTLVLHLQEFKKEQLKVQISNQRVLKISGERPLNASKRSRFYKEVKVGKESNANEIRAKFLNGLLYVIIPKIVAAVAGNEEAPLAQEQVQSNKQPDSITSPDDKAPKMHESTEEKAPSSQQESCAQTPTYSNLGTKIALVITLASAVGVYIFYRYKTIHDDGEFDDAFCTAYLNDTKTVRSAWGIMTKALLSSSSENVLISVHQHGHLAVLRREFPGRDLKKKSIKLKMDSKLTANYDEFEPLCNWQREEVRDTLVLHLPEFKKEQLKVQISNLGGVLKISGQRPLSALKQRRFYKEVKVAKECNANDIRAKFVNGLLYVVMPKTITPGPEKEEAPSAHEQVQANKQPDRGDRADDHIASAEEKTVPSQQGINVPTPSCTNKGTKLALVATLVFAIGVYVFYRYKTLNDGDFDDAFSRCFTYRI